MIASFIGLGSNLDNPRAQLERAIQAIARLPDSGIAACSSAYRSAAVGPGEQPDYLNAVLCLDTALPPMTLLLRLQQIENAQGRVRGKRWDARTLDLDILLYGEQRIDEPDLRVPHPRMAERPFVLYPLLEIAGANLMLPGGTELGTLVADRPRGELEQCGPLL